MQAKNIQDIYTLTPTQQGILFHILSAPNSGIYLEQTLCTLHGNLNVSIFEQSWQQVVDRHPSLRTAFIWENLDKPVQIVHRQVKLVTQLYDWRALSTTDQEEQLQAYLQADQKHGFELSEPPLMRLALISISEDTYQFIWSAYHLVLDAWCLNILLQEFFFIYEALSQGQSVNLEPCRPYRDYIAWLKQQNLSEAEAFWRQVLQGFRSPTPVPGDGRTHDLHNQDASFAQEYIHLSSATTEGLKSLAKQQHLTVNTLVLAAWALFLSHYSGNEDVLFGTVVSGRPVTLPGVEAMVGLFINTLPVRVQVTPVDYLLPWLKNLQSQQIKLRQYEQSPLAQVQSWSDVPKGLPLFESILVFQNSVVDISELPTGNLKIDNVRSFANSNYPIALVVVPGSQLRLEVRYDLRRFQPLTITRILKHIEAIINNIVAKPNAQLGIFLQLKATPLTVNYSALPTPELSKSDVAKNFVLPHTSTEKVIADIWGKVLQLEKIGIYDNFFELGGDSLLTIPVCSKMRETFNIDISVVDLFTYPTVSAFAQYLAQDQEVEQSVSPDRTRASRKKEAIKTQKQLKQQRRSTNG
ncbi:MAG: condensation domain-containing protein [Rhizonema sp. PD37]|nr:condensation domain-containing protein [Rhizonema sp. PD37]